MLDEVFCVLVVPFFGDMSAKFYATGGTETGLPPAGTAGALLSPSTHRKSRKTVFCGELISLTFCAVEFFAASLENYVATRSRRRMRPM